MVFTYAPDHAGESAERNLQGFDGIFAAGWLYGYNCLMRSSQTGGAPITVAHCWAHARRKLKEVFERDGSVIAAEGLRQIAELCRTPGRDPRHRSRPAAAGPAGAQCATGRCFQGMAAAAVSAGMDEQRREPVAAFRTFLNYLLQLLGMRTPADEISFLGIDRPFWVHRACFGKIRLIAAFADQPMTLEDRGQHDGCGGVYRAAHDAGDLITTSGMVAGCPLFLDDLTAKIGSHPVATVSCNRYRSAELLTPLQRAGIPWKPRFHGQGPKDGDAEILATRRLFLAGAIKLHRSQLLVLALGKLTAG